jgi:hypothetical protein
VKKGDLPATYNGNTVIKLGEKDDYLRDSDLNDLLYAAGYEKKGLDLDKDFTPGNYSKTEKYINRLKKRGIIIKGKTPEDIIKNFDTYKQSDVEAVVNNFTEEEKKVSELLGLDPEYPIRVLTGDLKKDIFLNGFYNFERILGKPNLKA